MLAPNKPLEKRDRESSIKKLALSSFECRIRSSRLVEFGGKGEG